MAETEQDTSQSTTLQQWQALKTQAENGELVMEEDIGQKLMARCDTFIDQLETALNQTSHLALISGFGTLKSAEYLRDKFARKAVADTDSAANRLKMSIDIITLMRQTFELSIRRVEETDVDTSTALGNTGA